MNYIKALKIYNDRKGEKNEWCVYRKGTPEYLEVMKIMKDFKEKPIKEKAVNIISNAIKIKQAKIKKFIEFVISCASCPLSVSLHWKCGAALSP